MWLLVVGRPLLHVRPLQLRRRPLHCLFRTLVCRPSPPCLRRRRRRRRRELTFYVRFGNGSVRRLVMSGFTVAWVGLRNCSLSLRIVSARIRLNWPWLQSCSSSRPRTSLLRLRNSGRPVVCHVTLRPSRLRLRCRASLLLYTRLWESMLNSSTSSTSYSLLLTCSLLNCSSRLTNLSIASLSLKLANSLLCLTFLSVWTS